MDDGRAGPDRAGRASTVRVDRVEGLPAALDGLGVRRGRPVLVLVGGAGGMDDEHLEILRGLLAEAVLPVVDERGAAVVDGGTDSGAMRVIGQARAADDRRLRRTRTRPRWTSTTPTSSLSPAPTGATSRHGSATSPRPSPTAARC
jgi:SLOG in TRPM, prokaryote